MSAYRIHQVAAWEVAVGQVFHDADTDELLSDEAVNEDWDADSMAEFAVTLLRKGQDSALVKDVHTGEERTVPVYSWDEVVWLLEKV